MNDTKFIISTSLLYLKDVENKFDIVIKLKFNFSQQKQIYVNNQ